MLHGWYKENGPDKRLLSLGALLRTDPDNEDNWLCQFDSHYYIVSVSLEHGVQQELLQEAFGWTSFPKCDFENLTGEE